MTSETLIDADTTESEEHGSHYRYPGAPPFADDELDRRLFQGRAAEAETVLHSILSSDLFLLYAESGLGKTSLLNAGVLHELRARGHWPVSVRLNDTSTSPVEGIREQILEAAARDPEVDLHLEESSPGGRPGASLWDLLSSIEVWRGNDLLRLVLILDQFEELFNLGWSDEDRQRFITEFGEVVRRHRAVPTASDIDLPAPDVRFVLVIREDSLGSLDALSADVPKIMRNRFRLGPLDPEQAEAAIREPAGLDDARLASQRFEYTPAAATEILEFLRTSSVLGSTELSGGVDPSQLQIVCQYVERAIVPGKTAGNAVTDRVQIDAQDLGGKAGLDRILSKFYRRTVDSLPAADQRAVRALCERGLINPSGRRLSLELGVIDAQYGVRPATLQALVDGRLLRAEPRVGSVYYELAHDTLVAAILADRNERLAQRQRHRRTVIASVAGLAALLILIVVVVAWIRSDRAASEGTVLELGRAEGVQVDPGVDAVLAVDDPGGGVLQVRVVPEDGRGVLVEVTDSSGSSNVVRSTRDGGSDGAVTMVMIAPGDDEANYDITVSALDPDGASVEIVADEVEPELLSQIPADRGIAAVGDRVVFGIDSGEGTDVVDVVPSTGADGTALDPVVEVVGPDSRRMVDTGRGGEPEHVVLTSPGRHYIVVSGATSTTGPFAISRTPAAPLVPGEPTEVPVADGGPASYFEVPGDGLRSVLVTPLDEDLDLQMQILVDGEVRQVIDESSTRELGFVEGSGEPALVRVARADASDRSEGEFRIEVSRPVVRVESGAAPETANGLTTFQFSNVEGELLELAFTPAVDDGDEDADDGDELVLDVFEVRDPGDVGLLPGARTDLATINRPDGGASLIVDQDDRGSFTVVASTASASDDPFTATLQPLANPIPDGEPIAANVSRPFYVAVDPGEQVEFAVVVDAETGPLVEIAWSDVDDESIAGGASAFLPGDSVGVTLGCGAAAGDGRRIEANVNLLAVDDREPDYEVRVRTNRVEPGGSAEPGIDWCGPRSSPSFLLGPTFVSLITRSGGTPEQAHCAVRAWHAADDGGPTGLTREFAVFERFVAAAVADDPDTRDAIIGGVFDEFDPSLERCGIADFVVAGALLRVDALLAGGSLSDL